MVARDGQMRAIAVSAAGHLSKGAHRLWWFFLLRGILAGMLGLSALAWPSASLAILAVLVGVFFVVNAASGVFVALRDRRLDESILEPVVSLVIGAWLLYWPGVSVRFLLMMLGAWALVLGISQMLTALRTADQDGQRGSVSAVGVIAALLGVTLILWPGAGVVAIAWVVALAAFVISALLIFLALRMKRLNDRLELAATNRG